ncbi:hypothetical protein [Sphingobium phenoxybenzoativorans]|uniref:hypothetical protein n=1 Tax=Sphingobium phenoxybenzoativorans TaxID=1592790 RepID=UPI001495D989|nr:hypothetical protein [Sphingobium phenoxybenzoativorans]
MPGRIPSKGASPRTYSVSLQQAAAAIFGVALIDGEPSRKPARPPRGAQHS